MRNWDPEEYEDMIFYRIVIFLVPFYNVGIICSFFFIFIYNLLRFIY